MKLNILFSFFKNKSELNSEDKLQTSFAGRRSSAWSYSYDLNVTQRLEEAIKLATKTDHSKIDFEDKHTELNLDEDLDDYIFEKNPWNHELTMIERIISASQVLGKISQKIQEDYLHNPPRSLWSRNEDSDDESVNDVKRLRLSHMQNQRSWLDRITKPFPKANKDEMKPEKMEKQQKKYEIQSVLIEYLWQFLHKTALPTIQKYEQLKKMYFDEKTKWIKKVELLEEENSWLKSELQNVDKSFGGTKEGLTNSKKSNTRTLLRNDLKGNFLLPPVPEIDGFRRSLDFDLEALVIPDVKSEVSLDAECTGETKDFLDFKQGYYMQECDAELEKAGEVNESHVCYKGFQSTKEKHEKSDTNNLQVELENKSLHSRNILIESTNEILPDVPENLKADNAPFESSALNAQQESHIAQSSPLTKLNYLTPVKGSFRVETSRDRIVCKRRIAQEPATTYLPDVRDWAGRKDSCETRDLHRSKSKTVPKTVFIDPDVLGVSDTWYQRHQALGSLDIRDSNVEEERGVVYSEKICYVNTSRSPDLGDQYRVGDIMSNNYISGSTVRSMWL